MISWTQYSARLLVVHKLNHLAEDCEDEFLSINSLRNHQHFMAHQKLKDPYQPLITNRSRYWSRSILVSDRINIDWSSEIRQIWFNVMLTISSLTKEWTSLEIEEKYLLWTMNGDFLFSCTEKKSRNSTQILNMLYVGRVCDQVIHEH